LVRDHGKIRPRLSLGPDIFRDFLSFDGCTAEKLRRRLLVIQYFPLEDYIDWLRKLMPSTTDIKFGL